MTMKAPVINNHMISNRRSRCHAMGLAEVLVSMLIISGLLVSALNTLGSANMGRLNNSDHARGHLLAEDLMSEILSQAYEEPVDTVAFGREGLESASVRTAYDDVDDYTMWASTSVQHKDGTAVVGFNGWMRTVKVAWQKAPEDLSSNTPKNTGIKRITVESLKNGRVMATMTAYRTIGPPNGKNCLFVAIDPKNLNAQEALRVALIESWGYMVTYVRDKDNQKTYDAALAGADVVYVSTEVSPLNVGTKLVGATIGVVLEEPGLVPQFGFGDTTNSASQTAIFITVNSHDITSGFVLGSLPLFTTAQPLYTLTDLKAPGIHPLAETTVSAKTAYLGLAYLNTGDLLYGKVGTAAGRRVMLPWGDTGFDFNSLNADAITIMQRATDWAAGISAGTVISVNQVAPL